jgi:hypothetical protein
MKISDTQASMLSEMSTQKSGKSKADGSFQKVMNEVMEQQDEKAARPDSANSPEFPPDISPTQMIRDIGGQNDSLSGTQVMKELENILDLAGFYSRKLGDPAIKTASLEPLITHLEGKMEGLRSLKENGSMDDKLKSIVSDLDLTLGTEVARFRRGDYY